MRLPNSETQDIQWYFSIQTQRAMLVVTEPSDRKLGSHLQHEQGVGLDGMHDGVLLRNTSLAFHHAGKESYFRVHMDNLVYPGPGGSAVPRTLFVTTP